MTIHELISKFDVNRIKFQRLSECLIRAQWRAKKGCQITFGNEMNLDDLDDHEALIVWIPREDWNKACDETGAD